MSDWRRLICQHNPFCDWETRAYPADAQPMSIALSADRHEMRGRHSTVEVAATQPTRDHEKSER